MSDGYDLFGGCPPHENTDTSIAAALSMLSCARTLQGAVYRMIRARGPAGATDDEIERAMGLRHQTASARRRELVLLGTVRDSGKRRRTDSGRFATVWVTDEELGADTKGGES